MVNILKQKTGGSKLSVIDAALVSLSKVGIDIVEPLTLNRITGGNVLLNSLGKLLTAGVVGNALGRNGSIVATGMVVSAVDGISASLFGNMNKNTVNGARTQDIASQ